MPSINHIIKQPFIKQPFTVQNSVPCFIFFFYIYLLQRSTPQEQYFRPRWFSLWGIGASHSPSLAGTFASRVWRSGVPAGSPHRGYIPLLSPLGEAGGYTPRVCEVPRYWKDREHVKKYMHLKYTQFITVICFSWFFFYSKWTHILAFRKCRVNKHLTKHLLLLFWLADVDNWLVLCFLILP